MKRTALHVGLLVTYSAVLLWSAIHPRDFLTWLFEVVPAVIGLGILLFTYRRFPLTNLTYVLLWISLILIAIGGHYSYANVPLFDWLRKPFDFQRNHYDRFVHFFQSITVAILFRELLLRKSPLQPGKWLFFLIVSICLAFSAMYEISEFAISLATGTAADAFLGTQGDIWDSQWDMLWNLVGAIVGLILFRKLHDRP